MTVKTRGIVRDMVVRLDTQLYGCPSCCMFDKHYLQCGIAANNDLSCLNGSFVPVPPEEQTDEEKTALVTQRLIGEEP